MKVYTQITGVLIVLCLATACAPTPAPTQGFPTVEPQPTSAEIYHSLNTRTGIEEIDVVLAAVEDDDPRSLTDLFSYSTIACMTVHALGGPPPCPEGKAEGTPVEVLPTLGSEGSYLYKDRINSWTGLKAKGIYAVYRVSENAYADENYPKGDYGVVLIGKTGIDENVVLQIKNGGIVRLDYIFDLSPDVLSAVLDRSATELILTPIE